MRQHKIAQTEARIFLGPSYVDPDLVFPNRFGKPLNPMSLTRTLKKVVRRAEVPKMRLHDFRHFHVSVLIQQGESSVMISKRLGHSNPSMTLDIYGHLMPGWQREAAESFASAMRRIS